jgi:hypothetical protein
VRLTIRGNQGSLHQFTQKVTNKHGEVVEYPKVRGTRDPDNPKHWRWQVTWKVAWVKRAIAQGIGIERIQEFLS